jgi:hypothetical protein
LITACTLRTTPHRACRCRFIALRQRRVEHVDLRTCTLRIMEANPAKAKRPGFRTSRRLQIPQRDASMHVRRCSQSRECLAASMQTNPYCRTQRAIRTCLHTHTHTRAHKYTKTIRDKSIHPYMHAAPGALASMRAQAKSGVCSARSSSESLSLDSDTENATLSSRIA